MDLRTSTPVSFVNVADRERALAFYCETLGLSVKSSDPFGDFIDMGGGLMRLTALPDYTAGQHPVLGWDVDDIEAAVRALGERGIVFTIYEGFGQDELGIWTAPDDKAKVAWFADPDGNVLSLSQS
jgi:catechol 2,3-dioxygenase-like lactoylglutathione lyase family enzyme